MYNIDEQQRMNEEGQHFVFLISTRPNMYGYMSIDDLVINAKLVFFAYRFFK